jgi:hypothetical protein
MSNFGVCGFDASQPSYNLSYAPISTSSPLNDGSGAAGIITDDLAQPGSSTTMFSYAPESTESVMSSTTVTATKISFELMSTTYTAVESTWAAASYTEASVTTVTALKSVDCWREDRVL